MTNKYALVLGNADAMQIIVGQFIMQQLKVYKHKTFEIIYHGFYKISASAITRYMVNQGIHVH